MSSTAQLPAATSKSSSAGANSTSSSSHAGQPLDNVNASSTLPSRAEVQAAIQVKQQAANLVRDLGSASDMRDAIDFEAGVARSSAGAGSPSVSQPGAARTVAEEEEQRLFYTEGPGSLALAVKSETGQFLTYSATELSKLLKRMEDIIEKWDLSTGEDAGSSESDSVIDADDEERDGRLQFHGNVYKSLMEVLAKYDRRFQGYDRKFRDHFNTVKDTLQAENVTSSLSRLRDLDRGVAVAVQAIADRRAAISEDPAGAIFEDLHTDTRSASIEQAANTFAQKFRRLCAGHLTDYESLLDNLHQSIRASIKHAEAVAALHNGRPPIGAGTSSSSSSMSDGAPNAVPEELVDLVSVKLPTDTFDDRVCDSLRATFRHTMTSLIDMCVLEVKRDLQHAGLDHSAVPTAGEADAGFAVGDAPAAGGHQLHLHQTGWLASPEHEGEVRGATLAGQIEKTVQESLGDLDKASEAAVSALQQHAKTELEKLSSTFEEQAAKAKREVLADIRARQTDAESVVRAAQTEAKQLVERTQAAATSAVATAQQTATDAVATAQDVGITAVVTAQDTGLEALKTAASAGTNAVKAMQETSTKLLAAEGQARKGEVEKAGEDGKAKVVAAESAGVAAVVKAGEDAKNAAHGATAAFLWNLTSRKFFIVLIVVFVAMLGNLVVLDFEWSPLSWIGLRWKPESQITVERDELKRLISQAVAEQLGAKVAELATKSDVSRVQEETKRVREQLDGLATKTQVEEVRRIMQENGETFRQTAAALQDQIQTKRQGEITGAGATQDDPTQVLILPRCTPLQGKTKCKLHIVICCVQRVSLENINARKE
ncbi:unnamed protein product [Amoebophrya sp. A120]|nr:unnamed protein product [Amoebophrya sp. A120]|eukprot:GSA120T00024836001.1